jgi:hypothetical protein
MTFNRNLFFFTAFSFLLLSCGGKTEAISESIEMNFNVYDELLGDSIILEQKKILLKAPAGWQKSDKSIFSRNDSSKTENTYQANTISVYTDSTTSSFLVISDWEGLAQNQYDAFWRSMIELEKSKWDAVRNDHFSFKEFQVRQLLLQNSQTVNFRFFIENCFANHVQIDLFVPVSYYQGQSHTIESVIGSVSYILN